MRVRTTNTSCEAACMETSRHCGNGNIEQGDLGKAGEQDLGFLSCVHSLRFQSVARLTLCLGSNFTCRPGSVVQQVFVRSPAEKLKGLYL